VRRAGHPALRAASCLVHSIDENHEIPGTPLNTLKTLTRCLGDYRGLWRFWLPLLGLTVVMPLLALAMPLLERQLIDNVVVAARLDLLPATIGAYAAVWAGLIVSQQISGLLRAYLGERYLLRLRQRVFDHCGALAVAFAHRQHSGRTMALFTNDLPRLAGFVNSAVVLGLASIVALVAAVVLMFSLSPQLALAGALAPLVVALIGAIVTRPLRPAARRVQEKVAEVTERLQEHLAGIREISAFGREHVEQTRFAATLAALLCLRVRVILLENGIQSGQTLLSLVVTMVLLGYGSYLVVQGQTTLGTLVAMRGLFNLLFQPLAQIVGLVASTQQALASAERIQAFLDEKPQVADTAATGPVPRTWGRVTFDHVSFRYADDRPVLHDLTFSADPGETIALVGESGAGKSTIASLLARFYDPTGGRVCLDGVDLRDLSLTALRAQIGFVFQDTFLFAGSVRDNIAFGLEGVDETQIVAASRSANAWEFIDSLPRGLDTLVGERGVQLSEGQRQRIGIARALVRDPRILILDEPTSALDARSEQLVQAALATSTRGRTTFVIAHRLATIEHADRILVLDGGRIAESGTHHELLERDGLYRQLFELQFGPTPSTPAVVARAGALIGAGHG
jgi:ABC-type multidrug transport system fused ATPase/permease subunit